jgi:hypothetical protein
LVYLCVFVGQRYGDILAHCGGLRFGENSEVNFRVGCMRSMQ